MRVKVSIGLVAAAAAVALAGCGNRTVIGSTPPPSPTPSPPGVTAEFPITTAAGEPTGVTLGTDSNLYMTLYGPSELTSYNVSSGVFTLFAVPTKPSGPSDITIGPDNDIWFTQPLANAVATLSASVVHEFAAPAGSTPAFITSGPNSSLFFTEPGIDAIGSISTLDDDLSGPYAIPTANADPQGIVVGPDNNIWFTEYNAAKIGRLNTTTAKVDEEIPLPAGSLNPYDIRQGPDGALWFTENNPAGPKIGRLSISALTINEYPLTGAASATALVVALDNNFYFTDSKHNAIGSFNINTLKTAEYPIPTANANPTSISLGPDPGSLYFTEQATDKLGKFTY